MAAVLHIGYSPEAETRKHPDGTSFFLSLLLSFFLTQQTAETFCFNSSQT